MVNTSRESSVPTLSMVTGPNQGAVFSLDQPIVILGRGGAADITLPDTSVSRRHAQLSLEDGVWGVLDLDSANGTFVNGRRISQRTPLAHGDSLRLGAVALSYDAPPATPAQPPAGRMEPEAPPLAPAKDSDPHIVLRVTPELPAGLGEGYTMFGGGRRSRVLDSLAKISSMVFDERALLAYVVEELLKALPQAERAFVMLWDAELERLVPVSSRTDTGDTGPVVASQTLLRDVLTAKQAVLVTNAPTDTKYGQVASMYALKMTSAVCAPILFQDEIFGVIQVDSSKGLEPFTRSDVALTLALALEVGMALAYARLHGKLMERELVERDLALARKIQHHFLPPRPPDVPGYGFAVEYQPALAVGGDLYDFVELNEGLLALAVGDVSGKGVSAALFAAKVMSDLRYLAAGETYASSILRRVNQAISTSGGESMFVTLALAVINPRSGRLSVASAGHPLPLVRDAAGHVTDIGRIGDKPLGVDERAEFTQYEYEIDPGDSVVLFTDGVVEALNRDHELYGDQRLIATVGRAGSGADQLVQAISSDVREFVKGHPQSDDVTVVCFDRKH